MNRRDFLKQLGAASLACGALPGCRTLGRANPAGNYQVKQGLAHWSFGRIPFEKLCAESKALGLHGIDMVNPGQWPILKKHGLICTMASTHGITNGLSEPKHHEGCLASITRMIDACAKAGFPNVITFSGNRRGRSNEEGLKNCVAALQKIAPHAEKQKVMINLEFLNSNVSHGDYMADSTKWCVELVERVGSPYVKVLYDIYHAATMGENCLEDIRKHSECWGHYHTAGVPGRNDIDSSQTLDYGKIIEAIADTRFQGYVVHEFVPKDGNDPLKSLKKAVEICTV